MDSPSFAPFAVGLLTGIFATAMIGSLLPKKRHGDLAFEKGDDDCLSLFYEPSETREGGKPFLMPECGTCCKEVESKMRTTQKEYKYLPDLIYASCVENLTLLCVGNRLASFFFYSHWRHCLFLYRFHSPPTHESGSS